MKQKDLIKAKQKELKINFIHNFGSDTEGEVTLCGNCVRSYRVLNRISSETIKKETFCQFKTDSAEITLTFSLQMLANTCIYRYI